MQKTISSFSWDPDPVAFYLPYFDIPIFIYGICFVTGFYLGYLLLIRMMRKELGEPLATESVDKLTWFVVAGTVIGARLGHVLFYDLDRYIANPWLILNTREGGLASHGGTIGVMLGLFLFQKFYFSKKTSLNFLNLLDRVVVPTALAACWIRIGNFFNQEIVGTPTNLPWGVLFGHPADGLSPVPRHPSQLYEAVLYLATFFLIYCLYTRTAIKEKAGCLTGIFFIFVFGGRFLVEFTKEIQGSIFDQSFLQAGQWLSLPFIALGALLIVHSYYPIFKGSRTHAE